MQHEFPGGFTFELAYVGRLGKHLLQSLDLAEPVDYTDPLGGGDYYTAGAELSKDVDQHDGNARCGNNATNPTITTIPYFENVFPFMANAGLSWGDGDAGDLLRWSGRLIATTTVQRPRWPISIFTATTVARRAISRSSGRTSSLRCTRWTLSARATTTRLSSRCVIRCSHGLQMDVSYTFSRSIDWGSDAERSSEFSGPNAANSSIAGVNSSIINTWKPYLNKAVSDFDTTSLMTADWVYELPFGKGKAFLGTANPVVQAILGGWQSSGIFRATSGLPFSLFEPGWTTDWQQEGYGVLTDPTVHTQKHRDSSGNVLYFANASAINGGVYNGSPVRLPYPGETGERNKFRGDGYFDLDSGLAKNWRSRPIWKPSVHLGGLQHYELQPVRSLFHWVRADRGQSGNGEYAAHDAAPHAVLSALRLLARSPQAIHHRPAEEGSSFRRLPFCAGGCFAGLLGNHCRRL